MNNLVALFDYIGLQGPIIISAITFFSLLNTRPYLYMFIVGSVLNYSLVLILKHLIKDPRPSNPIPYLEDDDNGEVSYGMPSGHAQISFFSITFLYLTKVRPFTFVALSVFIGCLTLYQRWKFRRHTLEQLVVGTVTGCAFSYGIYWMTTNYLQRIEHFRTMDL
jgi:membrane-associated phospholipid phosphatase